MINTARVLFDALGLRVKGQDEIIIKSNQETKKMRVIDKSTIVQDQPCAGKVGDERMWSQNKKCNVNSCPGILCSFS